MIAEILKLSRPRTWTFIVISFLIGWALTGTQFNFSSILGMVIFVAWISNVNLLNAYTDIKEDEINLPKRVKMLRSIEDKKLKFVIIALYILPTVLASFLPLWFLIVFLLAEFDGAFYSLEPLRFKANPFLSLLSFSGAIFFPMVGAWLLVNEITSLPVLILFLTLVFFVYGTVKNIPDYEGDKKANLKTTATIFDTRRKAIIFSSTLLLMPYLVLLTLIASGMLAVEFSLLFLELPIISLICLQTLRSKAVEKLEKLHTAGFIYQVSFLSLAFLIISHDVFSILLLAVIALILAFVLKTKIDSR
jgi:4-hydroxybenzoate polyprenyltransferase